MADRPRDLLQDIRNQVDTAESGWMAFKSNAMVKYDEAYRFHSSALTSVKETLKNDSERIWLVLNIVLSGALSGWVPLLLTPVKSGIDKLTNAWVHDALEEINGEAQDAIKGTIVEKMKNSGDSTSDPYEPVVDSTLIYGARLEHGIEDRAKILKGALDSLIANSEDWSMAAARSFQWSFLKNCPFITDVPADTSETGEFMRNFLKQAETRMWVEWALARDEPWWQKRWYQHSYNSTTDYKSHYSPEATKTLVKMQPVLDRLKILGVPLYEVSYEVNGYQYTGSTRRSNFTALDMLKMIDWAKHNAKMSRLRAPADGVLVCKAAEKSLLQLKTREKLVSYPESY